MALDQHSNLQCHSCLWLIVHISGLSWDGEREALADTKGHWCCRVTLWKTSKSVQDGICDYHQELELALSFSVWSLSAISQQYGVVLSYSLKMLSAQSRHLSCLSKAVGNQEHLGCAYTGVPPTQVEAARSSYPVLLDVNRPRSFQCHHTGGTGSCCAESCKCK